jgi:soluble lytic murein transglycosylase
MCLGLRGALLLIFAMGPVSAATPLTPMMAALRAQDWATAGSLASQDADARLAGELVEFIRLLKPAQAPAGEILAFMASHPDWPDRGVLVKRLGEAVIAEPDNTLVLPLCESQHFAPGPLARCADAFAAAGRRAQAASAARDAWAGGLTDAAHEADFLARWGGVLTANDEWRRFATFADSNPAAAAGEIQRLDPGHRLAAQARLAWKHDDPDAGAHMALVPADLRGDPSLVLDNARSLRRTGALAAAVALWRGAGQAAEAAAPPAARPPFWGERDALARKLLAAGNDADAAFIARDASVQGDQAIDRLFFSGWIELRRLHDTGTATADFKALAQSSRSAITQGRAHYWLARALADSGKAGEAHAEYLAAAAFPTTYYGQLAARELGDEGSRLASMRDPVWTEAQALALAGQALARAAELLVDWGDDLRARDFVLRLAEDPPAGISAETARAWDAHLALRLHMPEASVQIARMAGHAGSMLPEAGWPVPFKVQELAVMRQESNFDASVVSPAGARGLMQVMPATARTVMAGPADLFDPGANTKIGSAYLRRLLDQFGEPALATAAYNAGPNRVRAWLAAFDPARDATRLIDWIELIPFAETRNYVQRVLEAQTIYAHKLAEAP